MLQPSWRLGRHWAICLLVCCGLAASRDMDYELYHSLGLDTPFEDKPRSKTDSGMTNINGKMTREEMWGLQGEWGMLASQKYKPSAVGDFRGSAGKFIAHENWSESRIYPGTTRFWGIWVPSAYDGTKAANLVIFNDGGAFLAPESPFKAASMMENLIADGKLDVTIAILLTPGIRPGHPDCLYDESQQPPKAVADDPQRSLECDSITDRYSKFLLEDILPIVEADFKISQDPARRAIIGASTGGVGAFCAAWFRPDKFGLVATFSGSFVNIRGAHNLPWLIRNTKRKPIKMFLISGEHDIDNNHGSWALASKAMAAALAYAGYEHKFVFGTDSHGCVSHGSSLFPDIFLWLFMNGSSDFGEEPGRGGIGVRGAAAAAAVTGLALLVGSASRWRPVAAGP